jgi:hypothetical protein
VQDDDVAGPDRGPQLDEGPILGALVDLALALAERSGIAREAVDAVVDALGQSEEIGISGQHQPTGIDARATNPRQQCPEHLCDAAPGRGRVDVPDRVAVEEMSGPVSRLEKGAEAFGPEQVGESLRCDGRNGNLVRSAIGCHHSRSVERE